MIKWAIRYLILYAGYDSRHSEWCPKVYHSGGEHDTCIRPPAVFGSAHIWFKCGFTAAINARCEPHRPRRAHMSNIAQDSFKSCTTFSAALHVLQILAPDLIARLDEDFEVTHQTQLALCMHAARWGLVTQSFAEATRKPMV